ncbi:MAG: hypothetical protein L3K24_04230 [Gammaproteobacteria bacterium]|nr:hypothetical protein [Gammaproteobacteria bacterium]
MIDDMDQPIAGLCSDKWPPFLGGRGVGKFYTTGIFQPFILPDGFFDFLRTEKTTRYVHYREIGLFFALPCSSVLCDELGIVVPLDAHQSFAVEASFFKVVGMVSEDSVYYFFPVSPSGRAPSPKPLKKQTSEAGSWRCVGRFKQQPFSARSSNRGILSSSPTDEAVFQVEKLRYGRYFSGIHTCFINLSNAVLPRRQCTLYFVGWV